MYEHLEATRMGVSPKAEGPPLLTVGLLSEPRGSGHLWPVTLSVYDPISLLP